MYIHRQSRASEILLRSPTKSIYNYIYMSEGTCKEPKWLYRKIIYYWFFQLFFKSSYTTSSLVPFCSVNELYNTCDTSNQVSVCRKKDTGLRSAWLPDDLKRNKIWPYSHFKNKEQKSSLNPCSVVKILKNEVLLICCLNIHIKFPFYLINQVLNFSGRKMTINFILFFLLALKSQITHCGAIWWSFPSSGLKEVKKRLWQNLEPAEFTTVLWNEEFFDLFGLAVNTLCCEEFTVSAAVSREHA